jgi:hypothetical protein
MPDIGPMVEQAEVPVQPALCDRLKLCMIS